MRRNLIRLDDGVPASAAPRGMNEGLQGHRYAGQPRRACRRFHHGDTKFGLFLTALVSFLVIAVVVYFFVVTPYEKVKARFSTQESKASDPDDIVLLKEIRDLLASASRHGGAV